jgi:YVTN family beta-propeller protein
VSRTADGLGTHFRILGPLQVVVGGEERAVPGEKLQALLVRLLLEPNRPVAVERLIDDLWGDEPPATARGSLHAHVGRLRRALAPPGGGETPLISEGGGYVLRLEDGQLDAARFRSEVAEARAERRAGRPAEARARYGAALALWRGPPLEGIRLERAEAERAALEDLRLAALEERVDLDLGAGRGREVVAELEQLVREHPLRERLWAQLMLALYAAGRQADALAAYQEARRALDRVGLEPAPVLRELEGRILNQDPALAAAPLSLPGGALASAGARLLVPALVLAAALVVAGAVLLTRDPPPRAAAPAASGTAAPAAPRVVPDSLVELDPATNRVLSVTRVGHLPDSIAATADALWVANVGDRTIARVDPATKRVQTVGGAPVTYQLTSALNGDVWVSSFKEPFVTLVAPRGRLVASPAPFSGPARVRLPGAAEGLGVGGGYLWVTSPGDSGGGDFVSLVDLRTRRLVSSVPVGKLPLFATFGYGSAWVANYRGDSVSVVRPGSTRAETIAVPGGPLGIATGAGSVWVVTFWSRELVRIDPETRRVVGRTPVGDGPFWVAVGGGAVWVTNRDSRTITRVDPATGRVTATIPLGAAPHGIRFAHGRVWVTTQRCGSPVVDC